MGYYVNNEYPESEEQLREEPPEKPILEKCADCSATRALLSATLTAGVPHQHALCFLLQSNVRTAPALRQISNACAKPC